MENKQEEFTRKVSKPDSVIENEDGLLPEDEVISKQEYQSVFFNTEVYNEDSYEIVFGSEVINKFQRLLIYQEKLEPLKEKITYLQFKKYLDKFDVSKKDSKVFTLSILSNVKIENVEVHKSVTDGAYIYISIFTFRRILKLLGANNAQYFKTLKGEEEQFVSLRLWAYDNNFDIEESKDCIKIYVPDSSEENESTEELDIEKNQEINEENQSDNLTIFDYNSIFDDNFMEVEGDIHIKRSIVENLNKLITNMEAITPIRERFAFNCVKKFIEEDENIENLKEYKIYVENRNVSLKAKIVESEEKHELFTTLDIFKLILLRVGTCYGIYLHDSDKTFSKTFINLTKWVNEFCGEIIHDTDNKSIQINFNVNNKNIF